MPKICYVDKRFNRSSVAIIDQANTIIVEYAAQGYDLTLRQLYYQFVARGLIANRDLEYKAKLAEEEQEKEQLKAISDRWDDIVDFLEDTS